MTINWDVLALSQAVYLSSPVVAFFTPVWFSPRGRLVLKTFGTV